MADAKPVTIRGVTYPSYTAAAKANNVTKAAVMLAATRGTLDNVGLGIKKPITINGVKYASQREASKALGVSDGDIHRMRKNEQN